MGRARQDLREDKEEMIPNHYLMYLYADLFKSVPIEIQALVLESFFMRLALL